MSSSSQPEAPVAAPPHILVFDSGLGGLTVLAALRAALPAARFTYLADDAWFPYGDRAAGTIAARVVAVIGAALARHPATHLVVACNTASTIALPALRAAFAIPVTGTVPAIKPAAAATRSGLVSVLATPATVARDYTRELVAEHGGAAHFTLVGAPRLAQLAERAMLGDERDDAAVAAEIAPCFVVAGGRRTDTVVLACTHYPLIADRLAALAPWPVDWIDPAPAIARRVASLTDAAGAAPACPHTAQFTSGRVVPPTLAALLARHGLCADAMPPLALAS